MWTSAPISSFVSTFDVDRDMKFSIHVDTDKDFEKVADMDTYMFLKSEYAYG